MGIDFVKDSPDDPRGMHPRYKHSTIPGVDINQDAERDSWQTAVDKILDKMRMS
jgi:hypothetical protein